MTEDTSKSILGLYYLLRIAMTMCLALCVIALHFYFNTFKDKKIDEMIDRKVEREVEEIEAREASAREKMQNVAVAVAVMKGGTEDKVKLN